LSNVIIKHHNKGSVSGSLHFCNVFKDVRGRETNGDLRKWFIFDRCP